MNRRSLLKAASLAGFAGAGAAGPSVAATAAANAAAEPLAPPAASRSDPVHWLVIGRSAAALRDPER